MLVALHGKAEAMKGPIRGSRAWIVEQGQECGRPSTLHVEADCSDGRTSAVRVGGAAVFVSRGVMSVPEDLRSAL